jgi:hypothetical protein
MYDPDFPARVAHSVAGFPSKAFVGLNSALNVLDAVTVKALGRNSRESGGVGDGGGGGGEGAVRVRASSLKLVVLKEVPADSAHTRRAGSIVAPGKVFVRSVSCAVDATCATPAEERHSCVHVAPLLLEKRYGVVHVCG